jgi:hypothetical protein
MDEWNHPNLGTRRRCVVSFTQRQIYYQRKILRYPLEKRLGGPQSQSGRGGEEKEVFSLLLPVIESRSSSPKPSHYSKYPGSILVLEDKLAPTFLEPQYSLPWSPSDPII